MPEDVIQVPAGLTTDGLLGRRYIARFIDSMILALISIALVRNVFDTGTSVLATLLLMSAVWLTYGAVMESSPWQATLGKRVMGLRVYDPEGRRLGLVRAAVRNVVKEGPFLALAFVPAGRILALCWLGVHLIVLHRSPVYQAIHDRAAGTWVAAPESTIQLRLT